MSLILFGLATLTTIAYLGTMVLGYGHTPGDPEGIHVLAGILTAILGLVTHSLVFIYLIGTGLAVKEAVDGQGLDPGLYRSTRKFKGRAFPPALFSMIALIVVAAMGARADVNPGTGGTHHAWVLGALALNLVAFGMEIRVASDNARLLEEVKRRSGAALGIGTSSGAHSSS